MKKLIVKTAAIICLVATQSCNNASKTDNKSQEQPTKAEPSSHVLTSSVHVPLAEAQANIVRYNDMCLEKFGSVPIRAYTIHAADLLEVLGIELRDSTLCRYKHARAYLGLDSENKFKLYFTPVDSADLSVSPKKAGKDVILKDRSENYVLDLNAPCPMTCDFTSPLYYDASAAKGVK